MGFLRNLAASLLSLILFLTLTVFSVAFMLQNTVMNLDFVNNQVDQVPISDIARDFGDSLIGEQLTQDMPFAKDVALNVIEKQEPWIKEQLKDAITTGYDYLLGDTDTLYIIIPLSELKANLRDDLWDEAEAYIQQELAGKSDAQISAYLQHIIQQIPTDLLPYELASLPYDLRNLAIEEYLRDFAGLPTITGLPPEITGLVQDSARQYFDLFLDDFIKEVPDTYTIDSNTFDAGTNDAISTARTVIGYFQTYYVWLIVLMIVLAGLIFLVKFNIRAAARALGTSLIVYGGLNLIGIILLKVLSPFEYLADTFDIPDSLNSWLQNVTNDITSVALPLVIGLLVAGVVLLVVSFVVRFGKAKTEAET